VAVNGLIRRRKKAKKRGREKGVEIDGGKRELLRLPVIRAANYLKKKNTQDLL